MATLLLRDIMRTDPSTIESKHTVQDAANTMSRQGVRHLVVISPTGKPAGLVSQRDLFRHLAGNDQYDIPVQGETIGTYGESLGPQIAERFTRSLSCGGRPRRIETQLANLLRSHLLRGHWA